jgi:hypothetical protein
LQLPDLQVLRIGMSNYVKTSVHVEREKLSMEGRLTTTTLHPSFEALVHGVDNKAKKPMFCIGLDQDNCPRISLGGKHVSPIQVFKKDLKAIVWMLNQHGSDGGLANASQAWRARAHNAGKHGPRRPPPKRVWPRGILRLSQKWRAGS